MLVVDLSKCIGKLTYTVPRECVGTVALPKYILKIRRAGGSCYVHEFEADELDGDTVSFFLDDPIRELALGYWQADLFAGCDWIGESLLVKSLPTVTAVSSMPITRPVVGCKEEEVVCCPPVPPATHYATDNNSSGQRCQDATNCC